MVKCPLCGGEVIRHDGCWVCIPRTGCPNDELAKWEAECWAEMQAEGDEDCSVSQTAEAVGCNPT